MFADSMLETSWAQRTRRSCTTLTSFGLQAVVIGLLLLLPLLRTVGAPTVMRTVSTPISAGRPEPPSTPHPHTGGASPAPVNPTNARFIFSGRTPQTIDMRGDDVAPPQIGGGGGGMIGDTIGIPGTPNGFPISEFSGNHNVLPSLPHPPIREFRTSRMLEGSLIRRVQPAYPVLAKIAHIQGSVVLFAVISRSGTIDSLRVVSGHPLLVAAAVDAVKQWQYRPYILNQEPIEVETQITVNFILGN